MKKLWLVLAVLTVIVSVVQARDAYSVCVAGCAAAKLGNEQNCYWGTLPWEQELYYSCMAGAQALYDQCAADCEEKFE